MRKTTFVLLLMVVFILIGFTTGQAAKKVLHIYEAFDTEEAKYYIEAFEEETGLDAKKEFGEWNVAHKILLGANIPTIEQVGGDVDVLIGKRATFVATPWKFRYGDACPVRFVAMINPDGKARIDSGKES